MWPQVVTDWITGLAMQDYVNRHFPANMLNNNLKISRYINQLFRIGREGINRGTLGLSASFDSGRSRIELTLKGYSGRRFLQQAGLRLEQLLRKTPVTVVLRIEALADGQLEQLQEMLHQLSRHGDRVFIYLNNKLRPLVNVDSSVFNLVLNEPVGELSYK